MNQVGQYKVLFLPFAVMLSQDVADGLKRYVKAGGTAVAEARLAWNDARGFASELIPGDGLAEMFGAREKIIRPADKVQLHTEASPDFPGLPAHTIVTGEAFEEQLEPLPGGNILGRFADGSPAIVEKKAGAGKAILIGSFLALAYHRQHAPTLKHLFLSLAQAAGVLPDVEVSGGGTSEVEVRRLIGQRQETLLVFNHASTSADLILAVRLPWTVGEARELENNQTVEFQSKAGRSTFRKHLAPGESWVFSVRGS
jgi:beta-galactosidase